jgi:hypothetical protein
MTSTNCQLNYLGVRKAIEQFIPTAVSRPSLPLNGLLIKDQLITVQEKA